MPDILKSDFIDFLNALNNCNVEYIVVGGYAVIAHGYHRTTRDIDIWVNKSKKNYLSLRKAFAIFGMPVFDMTEDAFLNEEFDVFSFGRTPLQIDIITELKNAHFREAFSNSVIKEMDGIKIRFLHLNDLIAAKKAAGRHRDLDDIEKLTKKKL